MSRIPPSPSVKRPFGEARSRAASPNKPSTSTPSRTRTKSIESRPSSRTTTRAKAPADETPPVPKVAMSIKEAIAAKRAEAAKAAARTKSSGGTAHMNDLADALPDAPKSSDDGVDEVGRLSVRETIERARNTGD